MPGPILEKPHRLLCPCCGQVTRGRQWWNQDAGTGLCEACIAFVTPTTDDMQQSYGIRGIHYDLTYLQETSVS
jgi:hypothetical protein